MKVLGWALLLACVGAGRGQEGPIDPTWVYVSAVKWVHAPKEIHVRAGFAVVSVLFPEGRYVEVSASLIQHDKTKRVTFSQGDGTLIRGGTWSRTDDNRIRIHSRNVLRDNFVLLPPYCGKAICEPDDPGPFSEDNCALEGKSKTHLAAVIHCRRLSFSPLTLNLDLEELRTYANLRSQSKLPFVARLRPCLVLFLFLSFLRLPWA